MTVHDLYEERVDFHNNNYSTVAVSSHSIDVIEIVCARMIVCANETLFVLFLQFLVPLPYDFTDQIAREKRTKDNNCSELERDCAYKTTSKHVCFLAVNQNNTHHISNATTSMFTGASGSQSFEVVGKHCKEVDTMGVFG